MRNSTSGRSEPYTAAEGQLFLTGLQAVVRLVLERQRLDRATGLRTAAFVSGYEGSPLAGLDIELARRADVLREHDVHHEPAVNEELAATAVWGSQLAATRPDARYDGVVGYWYGKAPGLDRATDALRHANLGGAHPCGGALALVGDDPAAKSSTVPSASEHALADLGIPTFYPGDPAEVIELGLHATALSRASGLWTALKIVTNVADGGATVDLAAIPRSFALPNPPYRHEVTAHLIGAKPVEAETSAFGTRLEIAREYARANGLNTVESHPHDRIGIVAAGKTFLDVCEALERLGLDRSARERAGIRLLKLGLVYPLEPTIVESFANGLDEIVVVEEKRDFLETAIKSVLYGSERRTSISGRGLRTAGGELDPDSIVPLLARRLGVDAPERLDLGSPSSLLARTPYFCSGCPHNRSVRAPRGAVVGGGIGCHAIALLMDSDRVGDVIGLTQMGGEGTQWLGMAPFVGSDHLFQNIGDGTFHHSGSLAVRAAVAAGANITFKLLHNSAVAMTGGQQAVGARSVPDLTRLLQAEGVTRIIVTTEDPRRYRRVRLATGTEVWHRDRLEQAQLVLAETPGVTVLIHDQQCATEMRRARKRTPPPRPEPRVFINERVCEGCGDCGAKSNCLSVEPVETDFGRKTRIQQGSCNVDYSCLDGDCPSFMVVTPTQGRRAARATSARELPEPTPRIPEGEFVVRITGVGGTGIVTLAHVLARAAGAAGLHARTLEQTGLSQKAGAVVSDLKFSTRLIRQSGKVGSDGCDLYLGCDLLVASDAKNLVAADPSRTVAVLSSSRVPTGRMIVDTATRFPGADATVARIADRCRSDAGAQIDARALAEREFGTDQYANIVLLGAAYQSGALPLPLDALEEAIRANGVAVESNLRAFTLGRESVGATRVAPAPPRDLDELVEARRTDLVDYQDVRYADEFAAFVERVRVVEQARARGRTELTEAVARNLYKLMAYKDEYEVARLCLDESVHASLAEQFGDGFRYRWRVHPPLLRALGMRRKISLGPWARPLFRLLRTGRRLRGTPFDPFGMTGVRRVERRLITDYRETVDTVLASLDTENHALAVEIAALPDMVRGYETIKLESVARYEASSTALLAQFAATAAARPAA